jgi:hypothetical protein
MECSKCDTCEIKQILKTEGTKTQKKILGVKDE